MTPTRRVLGEDFPFVVGTKYQIRYRIETVHRVDRFMVAVYLGDQKDIIGRRELVFSGRPVFGTSELRASWVIEVKTVDASKECYADSKEPR